MTPTSKWMRFVSVSTPSRDFTKHGPTEGSLAKSRAASVELGGRSGLESVRSSSTPSLTIASCQHRNVANSRCCCWALTALGLLMPLPRRRTPDIPARGPLAESRRREPIRCQSGSAPKARTQERPGRTGSTASTPPTRRSKRGLLGWTSAVDNEAPGACPRRNA